MEQLALNRNDLVLAKQHDNDINTDLSKEHAPDQRHQQLQTLEAQFRRSVVHTVAMSPSLANPIVLYDLPSRPPCKAWSLNPWKSKI